MQMLKNRLGEAGEMVISSKRKEIQKKPNRNIFIDISVTEPRSGLGRLFPSGLIST